jgi:hypothetical protein
MSEVQTREAWQTRFELAGDSNHWNKSLTERLELAAEASPNRSCSPFKD